MVEPNENQVNCVIRQGGLEYSARVNEGSWNYCVGSGKSWHTGIPGAIDAEMKVELYVCAIAPSTTTTSATSASTDIINMAILRNADKHTAIELQLNCRWRSRMAN
jgi:hypothetical protein